MAVPDPFALDEVVIDILQRMERHEVAILAMSSGAVRRLQFQVASMVFRFNIPDNHALVKTQEALLQQLSKAKTLSKLRTVLDSNVGGGSFSWKPFLRFASPSLETLELESSRGLPWVVWTSMGVCRKVGQLIRITVKWGVVESLAPRLVKLKVMEIRSSFYLPMDPPCESTTIRNLVLLFNVITCPLPRVHLETPSLKRLHVHGLEVATLDPKELELAHFTTEFCGISGFDRAKALIIEGEWLSFSLVERFTRLRCLVFKNTKNWRAAFLFHNDVYSNWHHLNKLGELEMKILGNGSAIINVIEGVMKCPWLKLVVHCPDRNAKRRIGSPARAA
ncbi:hypothetical protein SELMODRAFT_403202 [Selaginella moellendorffii]|uniref:Uncharacterized protein n=1 Tax=Selaginella moellendorffii TaxID=88036 RepID=D8QTE5_SELML|nr:hypothetical protein SELMODRAFT_403202 [Selaginella moellendorffii]